MSTSSIYEAGAGLVGFVVFMASRAVEKTAQQMAHAYAVIGYLYKPKEKPPPQA